MLGLGESFELGMKILGKKFRFGPFLLLLNGLDRRTVKVPGANAM